MKNLICLILIFSFISNLAFASCDFSTGIKPLPDGNYEYSKVCHIRVGQLVEDNNTKAQQIQDLTKALSLKDLAIQADETRIGLWQKSADDELNRLDTMESEQKHSDWLFFALGAGSMFLAAYVAAKYVK